MKRGHRVLRLRAVVDQIQKIVTKLPDLKNVTALTQWYSDVLEKIVRVAPEQYWWMHRRWRDDRGPKQRAAQSRVRENRSHDEAA